MSEELVESPVLLHAGAYQAPTGALIVGLLNELRSRLDMLEARVLDMERLSAASDVDRKLEDWMDQARAKRGGANEKRPER